MSAGLKSRMTVRQVATFLDVSLSSVYRKIRDGTLPAVYEVQTGYVVLGADVACYRARRRAGKYGEKAW